MRLSYIVDTVIELSPLGDTKVFGGTLANCGLVALTIPAQGLYLVVAPELPGTARKDTVMADKKEPVLVPFNDARIPDTLRPLVEDGSIIASEAEVSADNKGQTATDTYVRMVATTYQAQLALSGGDAKVQAQKFNYGHDLNVRSAVREKLLARTGGPDVVIRGAIRGAVAKGLDVQDALEAMLPILKKKGLVPADYDASTFTMEVTK